MTTLPRRLYAITAIALAAVIFVALNIAADTLLTTERLDLTQTGVYTLARGTKHIVASIKEPITLRFFYTKKIGAGYPQINAYAKRVRDLLEEYAARSDGKIILQEVDPEPFTPEEDEATANGLSGAPTESGDNVYFGLVGTNTIDGKEAIPFFSDDREAYLEYDITSLIYRLSTPKKPLLGVISGLPLDTGAGGMQAAMQGQARPFVIYEQLEQTYATKMLDPNFASIPADVDVLMIVDPGPMTPQQLYAIDQFVLKGGRALVFVDPLSEIANAGQGMGGEGGGPTSSDLPSLFRAWGIAYNPTKVVADKELAQSVQVSADPRNPVAAYPVWLKLGAQNFAGKDQVTANLQALNLASVGALSPMKGATTTFLPLIWSSKEASLLDAAEVKNATQPQDLINEVEPTGKNYVIAARISGPVKTSFPSGAPLSPADLAKAPRQIMASKGPINVIVMADTDIFDDRFWVRVENLYGKRLAAPFADNAAFVLNSVENLTGSDDLISLRTRATNSRPFVVVQKLQAEAQAQFQQRADALKQQLTDTETRLRALEQGGSANGQPTSVTSLTPEQQSEIESFKRELAQTRTELRDVQHNLRKDIDELGAFLAFINIALMPLIVACVAITLAVLRRRRRARAISM
ncbi:MAG TPA: Gldg family protein [Rhizomicrobium sp.]|nr:Gldg family protein [Rhizomicrobium sp.]